ncbi:DnaD domain protein [Paenibacillus sp. HN-1]|uniref:DnaD domain protein n=1 Tax=Paenibacillus TaxID=44249 RepID=UPI001CA88125|nr:MULTISPECIES: DnaD domain protein [Paenibacillus]MBY9081695.1 DnaD domain protein [Paenibacillus sp. CGMCC 1.18879]MBY9083564.1 DnaD domain protein [Paenibacillus sinensis]
MDSREGNGWANGLSFGLQSGMAVIPYALLTFYRKLNLTGSETLLLIHLLSFRQVEGKDFPSLEELQAVTGRSASAIAGELQKLIKEGFLRIEAGSDDGLGLHYERYDFSGLYDKLGRYLADQREEDRGKPGQAAGSIGIQPLRSGGNSAAAVGKDAATAEEETHSLFVVFEREFGRPLSPMEFETIAGWLDQDRYPEELIRLALKESVFAGKVYFRYIDRILLEWSRNRVKNAQDVKAYSQRFRGGS